MRKKLNNLLKRYPKLILFETHSPSHSAEVLMKLKLEHAPFSNMGQRKGDK